MASNPTALVPSIKCFDDGQYLIFRKTSRSLSKRIGGSRLPRFRHASLQSAEREACRLSAQYPESTFIIMREVATVKPRPVEVVALEMVA